MPQSKPSFFKQLLWNIRFFIPILKEKNPRLRIGVILILLSFPMGWIIGPTLAFIVVFATKNEALAGGIILGCYLLNWTFFLTGSFFAGKDGKALVRRYRARRRTLIERFHRWEEIRAEVIKNEAIRISSLISNEVTKITKTTFSNYNKGKWKSIAGKKGINPLSFKNWFKQKKSTK